MGKRKKGMPPMPVRIRGIDYPSHEAAAKALGVAPCTVSTALTRGRADFIGFGLRRGHRRNQSYSQQATAKTVQIGSLTWPSQSAAARALRMPRKTLAEQISAGKIEQLIARAMAAKAREEGHKARRPRTHDAETQSAISETMKAVWDRKRGEA